MRGSVVPEAESACIELHTASIRDLDVSILCDPDASDRSRIEPMFASDGGAAQSLFAFESHASVFGVVIFGTQELGSLFGLLDKLRSRWSATRVGQKTVTLRSQALEAPSVMRIEREADDAKVNLADADARQAMMWKMTLTLPKPGRRWLPFVYDKECGPTRPRSGSNRNLIVYLTTQQIDQLAVAFRADCAFVGGVRVVRAAPGRLGLHHKA